MSFIKSILALLAGLVELALAQHFLNFPPVPVFSVYIAATAFLNGDSGIFRPITTFICCACGCALYGYNIYMAVTNYPMYGNWLGIAFDAFTLFLIFGAGVVLIPSFLKKTRS